LYGYTQERRGEPDDTEKPVRVVTIPIKQAQKQQGCYRRDPYLGFLFRCYSDP